MNRQTYLLLAAASPPSGAQPPVGMPHARAARNAP
jgi:hypothetical protein